MTKQIYIINGSPRKNWNTSKLCESFAKGVVDAGGNAEIITTIDYIGSIKKGFQKVTKEMAEDINSNPDKYKKIKSRTVRFV